MEHSREGARELGCLYWSEVEQSTFGLVRVRFVESSDGERQVELRVLDRGPVLLVFAPADIIVSGDGVTCRFAIRGGLLARGPRGSLTLTQLRLPAPGLRSVVTGFHPRLAARPGRPRWSRPLYALVQHRLHVWISRRFFRALAEGQRHEGRRLRRDRLRRQRSAARARVAPRGDRSLAAAARAGSAERRSLARGGRARGRGGRAPRSRESTPPTTSCTRSEARDFEERDARAAENVARAAERAGVRRLVYLGGLGDDAADLSSHLRSRRETGLRLASGTVPVTTLRAAIVVGRGSAAFETIVALVERLPVMVCPRWVTTPTQPIALDDVVHYLSEVADRPDLDGGTFDVGGPEVLTYRDMIERIGKLLGRRSRIVEVPVLTPRLSSYWLHLVTPVGAAVARPLIEGLRNETVVRDTRIRSLIPLELTSFDVASRARARDRRCDLRTPSGCSPKQARSRNPFGGGEGILAEQLCPGLLGELLASRPLQRARRASQRELAQLRQHRANARRHQRSDDDEVGRHPTRRVGDRLERRVRAEKDDAPPTRVQRQPEDDEAEVVQLVRRAGEDARGPLPRSQPRASPNNRPRRRLLAKCSWAIVACPSSQRSPRSRSSGMTTSPRTVSTVNVESRRSSAACAPTSSNRSRASRSAS